MYFRCVESLFMHMKCWFHHQSILPWTIFKPKHKPWSDEMKFSEYYITDYLSFSKRAEKGQWSSKCAKGQRKKIDRRCFKAWRMLMSVSACSSFSLTSIDQHHVISSSCRHDLILPQKTNDILISSSNLLIFLLSFFFALLSCVVPWPHTFIVIRAIFSTIFSIIVIIIRGNMMSSSIFILIRRKEKRLVLFWLNYSDEI